MFLGGNWQLKDLQAGLSPAEFAKWDIAPIPQADAATRSTGTGGWVWVVFARDPARQRAAIEFIRDVEAPAHAARISEATGHLPVRRSVYRDFPIFSQDRVVPAVRRDAGRRPRAADRADLPGDFAAACSWRSAPVVSGEKTPDAGARRGVARRERANTRGRRSSRTVDGAARRRSRSRGCRSCSRSSFPVAMFWRGRRDAPARVAWVLPAVALVTIILIYPMLDLLRLSLTDATVAGSALRIHARELSGAARRRRVVLRHGRRDGDLRRRARSSCS